MSRITKVLISPIIVVLVIAVIPIVLLALIYWGIVLAIISVAVLFLWIPRGFRFLIIYSESSQWKTYFEEEVVPAFGRTARVINLSRDGGNKKWWHLDWWIYRHCVGHRNRFPIVFRFSPFGTWKTIRFYKAYMQSKKGNAANLDKLKADLILWHP